LPFYDIKPDEIDTPRAYERYEKAAPITYLSKDDPPALLTYSYPNEEVTEKTPLGLIVHHPKFGIALKERMDKLGIQCIVQYQDPQTRELVRHEQGATHAADGFARATGKPGVVMVTSGPGITNAITGIATAYMDSIPMVVLSGQVMAPLIGYDAFQEIDAVGISRPCVKHNFLIHLL